MGGNRTTDSGTACLIDPTTPVAGQKWLTSHDTGATWSAQSTVVLQFTIDAQVTTQGTTETEHRFLRGVDVRLRALEDHAASFAGRINLPNYPGVP